MLQGQNVSPWPFQPSHHSSSEISKSHSQQKFCEGNGPWTLLDRVRRQKVLQFTAHYEQGSLGHGGPSQSTKTHLETVHKRLKHRSGRLMPHLHIPTLMAGKKSQIQWVQMVNVVTIVNMAIAAIICYGGLHLTGQGSHLPGCGTHYSPRRGAQFKGHGSQHSGLARSKGEKCVQLSP